MTKIKLSLKHPSTFKKIPRLLHLGSRVDNPPIVCYISREHSIVSAILCTLWQNLLGLGDKRCHTIWMVLWKRSE
jgi:hypothetical protein